MTKQVTNGSYRTKAPVIRGPVLHAISRVAIRSQQRATKLVLKFAQCTQQFLITSVLIVRSNGVLVKPFVFLSRQAHKVFEPIIVTNCIQVVDMTSCGNLTIGCFPDQDVLSLVGVRGDQDQDVAVADYPPALPATRLLADKQFRVVALDEARRSVRVFLVPRGQLLITSASAGIHTCQYST